MIKASPAQHGMWFTERLGIAATAYHMPLPVHLTGPLDLDALRRACDAVVARHRALSDTFILVDEDLFVRPADSPATLDAETTFDLDRGPLIRFSLRATGPDRHLLLIEAHHLVFDGPSKDILLRDLAAAYSGESLLQTGPVAAATGDVEAARGYWAGRWAEPEPVVLPGLTGGERTAQPGASVEFEIGDVGVDGFSRFEVLFATLQGLLASYGNEQPTIAVDLGTRDGANRDEIGLFVNELPVRATVHDGQTLRGLLAGAREQLRELYRHRRVPLSQAVQGLGPRLAMAPVSISYRRRVPAPVFAGLAAEIEWMSFHGTARNALHVQMVDDGTNVQVRLHFDPRAVAASYVELIAQDYLALLDCLVADLPWPGRESRLEGQRVDFVGPRSLHWLVWLQTAMNPDAIAIVGADRSYTYAELVWDADVITRRLRELGVGPGDRVAVRMRRTPQMLVALLGVLSTGAAYVPIDPAYPPARQSLLLSDAEPAALVTDDGVIPLAGGPKSAPGLAYVTYTSGSTGRPKGVEVEHRSVVNLLHSMRDEPGTGRWLAVASFAFDMSVPELWLPLISGGAVVLATDEQTRDGEQLLKLVRMAQVTHVHVTPSTWQRLVDAGFDEPDVIAMAGAEALPAPLAKQIRARAAQLWNLYGPTETTVWSAMAQLSGDEVSIGGPIANTSLHVLDERLRPVAPGIPGELCIGGAGVTRGYFQRPDLTNERFVHTRWGRLYRTGDRVRLTVGGRVEWIGRFDDQIKLRGYRIEVGEIEARLLEVTGVRAAAVAANPELTAYVVGSAEGLKEHLAQVLPAYMVPTAYLTLDALPLTPNGKLDRAALPAPVAAKVEPVELTGPAKEVFDVWAEVLGRNDFGVDDSLFDLGGHSLTVTKISSRLRKRGIIVPLHIFFDHPTVSGIAAVLTAEDA